MRIAIAAVAVSAAAAASTAASATPASGHTAPTLTRSAHVAFENCNAQHLVLVVTVVRHAFTPNEPVTYTVRLRNTGRTTCGAPLAEHVPQARGSLTVGPCGTLSAVVSNAAGVDVSPGPLSYFCPDDSGFRLGPDSTATTTGSWDQMETVGSEGQSGTARQAPPGHYLVTVDRAVSVPVTLVPG